MAMQGAVNAPRRSWLSVLAALALFGCARPARVPATRAEPVLRDVYRDAFLIGAAVNARQFSDRDTSGAELVTRQFNTISPENVLTWALVHPQLGRYDFGPADQYVAFGEANGMFVVGHTLVWHSQLPRW